MFGNVESFILFLFVDPDAHSDLQGVEDCIREDEGEGADGDTTDELSDNAVICAEDSYGEGSPDSTNSVNRDRTDRVVDLDLVEEEDGEDNQNTGDEANND